MESKAYKLSIMTIVTFVTILPLSGQGRQVMPEVKNLAIVATASGSARSGTLIPTLNDLAIPEKTGPVRAQGNAPQQQTPQWIQYDWENPVATDGFSIFWWNWDNTLKLPKSIRILWWDGTRFMPVTVTSSGKIESGAFSEVKFNRLETSKLRIEVDSADRLTSAALEWVVFQAPGTKGHPPVVTAGSDRVLMTGSKTYLNGRVKSVTKLTSVRWTMKSGPGKTIFADPQALSTTATFSTDGEYLLTLTVTEGDLSSSSDLKVKMQLPPPAARLDVVYTKKYKINSPLWNDRAKSIIVNWIPWCIDQINRTNLTLGQGGLDNFIEAGKALRGEPHGKHLGYVFSNAWVHQTVESMCIALMVDPQGDKEIIAAQEKMKKTLEEWIPVILAAQEPDGYLMTAFTLRDKNAWKSRWEPENRGNHEGYVAGYFIESAINHYTLTEGKDLRLYNAAKKLADCWVANIGPGKKEWFDGHQEMEQALVRFGRFVNDMEGNSRGDCYVSLAKFLLDCRGGGSEYDQSHVPVQQQYEAVGHAVRAVYNYSAMSDVAAETGDADYQSATMSLWDNIVNKKYYLTGGVGSGETSEGFGPDYSLRNNAYCESCSSCGLIFFQHKMNIAYHDAKYADLYEETMYNALLGAIDMEGKYFYYDNPLESARSRYSWHGCPCCVGNIPRTLLMVPTWTYVKGPEGLYVNMFIGSTIKVEKVAGTDLEVIQETDYPWSGKVTITINPVQSKEFTLFIRIPDRTTSELYKPSPEVSGYESLVVNGKKTDAKIEKGYAAIKKQWKKGDKVELVLPMKVQKITADQRIVADRGKVAIKYGPLVYNVERADQPDIDKYIGLGPLNAEWNGNLLRGVMTIKGTWDDGSQLIAIPNYARNNRNSVQGTERPGPDNKDGGSIVWIKTKQTAN